MPIIQGTIHNRKEFTGKEFDNDGATISGDDGMNLYYFGARFYDPEIGRWISTDPADEFWDAYSYTGGDPIHLIDPEGTDVLSPEVLQAFAKAMQEASMSAGLVGGGILAVAIVLKAFSEALKNAPESAEDITFSQTFAKPTSTPGSESATSLAEKVQKARRENKKLLKRLRILERQQRKQKKEKNIRERRRGSTVMNNYTLIPFKSVGPFRFGTKISDYLENSVYNYIQKKDPDETNWDCYEIESPKLDIYVENGLIQSIACYKKCILNGKNIIKIKIGDFISHVNEYPDLNQTDAIFIGNEEKPQVVYEFDKFGLQVWVKEGIIITVYCSPYIED